MFQPTFKHYAVALLAFVLAGVMLTLALEQYRHIRRASTEARLGHAFWLLLGVGFAGWLVSIGFWTLDDRPAELPELAVPFVVVAALAFGGAFAIRFTPAGRRLETWLARLPPRP